MTEAKFYWRPAATRINPLNPSTVELIRKTFGFTAGGMTRIHKTKIEYLKGLRDAAKCLLNEQYPVVNDLRGLIDGVETYGEIEIY